MSATFYERAIGVGDYDSDGGLIDLTAFFREIVLFEAGLTTAAALKTAFSLTTAQGNDLDDVLATMPGLVITLTQAATRARWAQKVYQVFYLGRQGDPRFDTTAECKTAIGV